eukprot:GGOE01001429.1.p1 GENE.GGOE01001429.1~~GGOE01001429.1.p1  ORF type:complete len:423 (+),score=37.84 GGOE01001429.1:327-1595(+)
MGRPRQECHRRWHALVVACAPGGACGWAALEEDALLHTLEEHGPLSALLVMLSLPSHGHWDLDPVASRIVTCTLLREFQQAGATTLLVDVVRAMRQQLVGEDVPATARPAAERNADACSSAILMSDSSSSPADGSGHNAEVGCSPNELADDASMGDADAAPATTHLPGANTKHDEEDKMVPTGVGDGPGLAGRHRLGTVKPECSWRRCARSSVKARKSATGKRKATAEAVKIGKGKSVQSVKAMGGGSRRRQSGHNDDDEQNKEVLSKEQYTALVASKQDFECSDHSNAFPCEQCDVLFSSNAALRQHLRSVHPHVRLRCNECDSTFKTSCGLQRHIQIKHAQAAQTVQCGTCMRTFTTVTAMRRHEREQHGGAVKTICDVCCKAFFRPCEYFAHVARHFQLLAADSSPVTTTLKCEPRNCG